MMPEDRRAGRATGWTVAAIWLIFVAVTLYLNRYYIETVNFRDPDDALRLVEVRNWMAGQSWFDVTQYRSHPPMGSPMHWSRLVDLPIAFFISLYGLFASPFMAERLAMTTVPLLMSGGLFLLVHKLTVRVTGRHVPAIVSALMLATSVGVMVQFQPLRIDHHGWQILLSLLAIWCAVGRSGSSSRNAALAGLVMAVNLTVAVESLPLAVALGGVLALRYLRRAEAFADLFLYVLTLGGGAGLLLLAMLGWQGALVPWCDAMSPAYVLPLLLVAALMGVAGRMLPQGAVWQRMALLAIAGGAGALLVVQAAPQCLRGPFSTLDPMVYRLWYVNIKEGMPVWTQSADLQILVPLPGILGLIGTLFAIRFDAVERRALWIEMLILQSASFAVSMMVMRAMGIAHVLAMPGNAWLFLSALSAAMRLGTAPGRVLLGFCCFALTPLGGEVLGVGALMSVGKAPEEEGHGGKSGEVWDACVTRRGFEQLNRIPQMELMTPLDIGSHLLAFTHHDVIATGHHRNVAGIKQVLTFFTADPDQAHAIISKTPARYVGYCPTENEGKHYAHENPNGLMALLMKDRPPAWLQPVPLERKDDIRLYKVID